MINEKKHPVEWALLLHEMSDTQEHLSALIDQLQKDGECSQEEFAVRVGHLYAHLNRVWNSRSHVGEVSDQQFAKFSEFPTDIDHVG
jgi:hypothetical protein